MKDPRPTLTLSRLEQLLDAYGGEPAAWPELERAAALALIERDAQARELQQAALALDAKLELSELSDVVSPRLRARVLEIPIIHAPAVAPARSQRFGLFALFALAPCVLGFVTGNFWLEQPDPDDEAWGELLTVANDLFDEESP
jgi:hypothetical protein